jgi:imidazolonepropionase-like amidohydrolase
MQITIKILVALSCISGTLCAQYAPAPVQKKSVLILNATAHLGNGTSIANAAVGFKEGKINLVADATTIKLSSQAYDTIIQAAGMHLYPGFIAPNINLGLIEMEAVRATSDFAEVGEFKPHVRSLIAYNTDSEIIPTVRSNGVLITQVCPKSGVIPGTSSVVHLDAWNWEDAVIRADDGVHLEWPSPYQRSKGGIEPSKSYAEETGSIMTFFQEAKAYSQVLHPAVQDPKLEAMRGVFSGKSTLYVHAENQNQLVDLIAFCEQLNIQKTVIVGGTEAPLVSELILAHGMSVMVPRVHSLPRNGDDPIDAPFTLAKRLFDAGIPFCFQNEGDMEAMNSRNLPFLAGTAVGYGLPYEQAVKGLTLGAAQIVGIDAQYGSIETGKSATLFLSTGDALDMATNHLSFAWIDGRCITLRNRQMDLYLKYKNKYGQ